MEIRALLESDDRSGFDSGDMELDRFFRRFAGQNQFRHQIGVTYVAVQDDRVVGFATVSPGSLEIENIPLVDRKTLPRYPVPILRLARLAVDRTAQGKGVGAELLRFVLGLAVRLGKDFGCSGVLVDAKTGAVAFCEKYGFIRTELLEGASAGRPRPVTLFLALRKIQRALE